ncbi:hypothetical protein [Candidatus Tisiphia endosymbiont of Mystacides longicornis]|uniref:hypothetical protein n=1 Tax=Candidatus Tisiphia endosymbiont of Mystacides longicornis TaxID=3139330 RepID=UPI003CCB6DE4
MAWQSISIVNSGELGSRNDGATPISNRRVTTSPTSHQLTIITSLDCFVTLRSPRNDGFSIIVFLN